MVALLWNKIDFIYIMEEEWNNSFVSTEHCLNALKHLLGLLVRFLFLIVEHE